LITRLIATTVREAMAFFVPMATDPRISPCKSVKCSRIRNDSVHQKTELHPQGELRILRCTKQT